MGFREKATRRPAPPTLSTVVAFAAFGGIAEPTIRRRAEEALRASEDRLRTIVELAPVGIAQAELPAGRIVLANARMCEITGYPAKALLGKTFLDLAHPEDRQADAGRLDALLRGEVPVFRAETRYLRPDGGIVWVQVALALLPERRGSPPGTIGVVRDVTAEHAASEGLRAARVDLARLTAQLLRAEDEERRRLARELHDGPAQLVVAANLALARVRDARDGEERARALEEAEELCSDAAQQVRTFSYLLHPPVLNRGLVAAIRWCAEGFTARSRIAAEFRGDDPGRLPPDLELTFFRVVQEALTNVQRHAAARSVAIELRCGADRIEVSVRDDGRGFGETHRPGVGIAGMRERLRLVGGTLEIRSEPGRTEIRARAQLDGEAAAARLAGEGAPAR